MIYREKGNERKADERECQCLWEENTSISRQVLNKDETVNERWVRRTLHDDGLLINGEKGTLQLYIIY